MDEFSRTIGVMAEAMGKRAGRSPDDLAVRALAGAVIGVMMSVTMPWHWADGEVSRGMFEEIDAGLALLEAGLPL
jgi:hypothetical protein